VLFDDLVAQVGSERYTRACEAAWASAAGAGRCGGARSFAGGPADVPDEFGAAWYHSGAPLAELLEMALTLYREMPCYANTMELVSFYDQFGVVEREAFWDEVRSLLGSDDDRLADPMSYALWVDLFEDAGTVEEAWREATRRDATPWERRVARVLDVAGPVPWALKAELFEQLVGDVRWHPAIFRALAGSTFDVFGQLDPAAGALLERLRLAPDTPDLTAVRGRLAAGYESQPAG
jgi:hypothetical protein